MFTKYMRDTSQACAKEGNVAWTLLYGHMDEFIAAMIAFSDKPQIN